MKKISILSVICSLFVLGGCDHYSERLAARDTMPGDIASISPAAGGEMTFSQYLANEYYTLARYENDEMYDYRAAKYYTEKAEDLSEGKMVSPTILNDFSVVGEASDNLVQARYDLLYALRNYNIPENRYNLAVAQSRYDCWVDQELEENPEGACQRQFKNAMDSLVISENDYSEEEFYDDLFDINS